MLAFKKYPKIHSIEKKDKIIGHQEIDNNMLWIVTEKVHGTNLSFIISNVKHIIAKRTGVINEDENFYNYEEIEAQYLPTLLALFIDLNEKYNDTIEQIQVYGEMFGKLDNGKKIQKEIDYGMQDYVVFDILITLKNKTQFFMDFLEMINILSRTSLNTPPILFIGTFEQCLNVPNEGVSIVGIYNNIFEKKNIMEGIVIRPNKTLFNNGGKRIIFKSKNEKFKENKKTKTVRLDLSFNEFTQQLYEKTIQNLTENRLINLFTKGEVEPKWEQFGKISGLLIKDAMNDLDIDIKQIEKQEIKMIKRRVKKVADDLVRKYLEKEGV